MELYLKVSPKGQVTLPKRLRKQLQVDDLIKIELKDFEGIMKKPDTKTEKLAGCFKEYYLKKKIPIDEAAEKALIRVANEIAQKDH